jgi:hypothetical protein
MSKQLPQPVEIYMDSLNTNDTTVIDACMAKDAHIHDSGENNHVNGIEAIKEWREKSVEFELKSKVIDAENKHGIIIVSSLTSGIFPGSPQLFYYFFTVAKDLITNIEIVPGADNFKQ